MPSVLRIASGFASVLLLAGSLAHAQGFKFSNPDPSQEASDLDASNLRSLAKEYIAGLQDSQSVTITGQRIATNEGQNFLRDNSGAAGVFPFRNTYSDGSVLTYSSTIKKFGVTGGTDAVMMFTATVRPSGAQVWSGTGGPTT